MPKQFDRYRFRDGLTKLDAATFNAIFRDVDNRVAALEALGISWDDAVALVTSQGLKRIDAVLKPSLDAINASSSLASQTVLDAQTALAALPNVVMAADIAKPSAVNYTYDANGNVTQQVEIINAVTRSTNYTYDGNGNINIVVIADGTITRTETYTYDANGLLTGMSATEI